MRELLSEELLRAMQDCEECHNLCNKTVTHCLNRGGEHSHPSHIGLLFDCAEICQSTANFILRGSPLYGHLSAVCSKVCEMCAQDCERLGDDATMRACAEACRRCAETTRKAAMAVA
ncbi:MAG: four-helix bundle copper-binding protein [Elusimicrobia bacterium]|nr:four-helix bundle copper-binding protein [Elusimicrobiota bacterium]